MPFVPALVAAAAAAAAAAVVVVVVVLEVFEVTAEVNVSERPVVEVVQSL